MNGSELITAERRRQIDAEGYTVEHDAGHADPEHFAGSDLREAALCYLRWGHATHGLPGEDRASLRAPSGWPWDEADWKPSPDNQVRDLVKAGALIAAEIDRLASLAASPTPTGPEPAKCEHKRTEEHWGAEPSFFVGYCPGPATPTGTEPLRVYRERPRGAAATPEPTEETPRCNWPDCAEATCRPGCPNSLFGSGGADPKETRE